jgi:serine protease Do
MSRRLIPLGVVTFGLMSTALVPHVSAQTPPTATVPTAKRVITTPAPTASQAPAAPSAAPATKAPPPTSAPAADAAPSSVEQARRGVVSIERQGKPLALALVLEGDGRMLTALSALGDGNFLSARYADGASVTVRLVHSDRGWDLALLSPAAADRTEPKPGLRAARTPSFVGLSSFVRSGTNVAVVPAALKLSPGMLGGDGKALGSAYELGLKPGLFGAPVVNSEGEVVAIVARACPSAAKPPCVPSGYGVPVAALKQFLQRVPQEATWLGFEAAADEGAAMRGVRAVSLTPNGPAAIAGIRPGKDAAQADLILAVDGAPVTTPAELNAALRARTSEDAVELLVFGLGRYRTVTLKPRPMPSATPPTPPSAPRANPYR